ncbi:hypothetical protein ACWEQL_05910 [Kitasatospora sp. NPDC004240]
MRRQPDETDENYELSDIIPPRNAPPGRADAPDDPDDEVPAAEDDPLRRLLGTAAAGVDAVERARVAELKAQLDLIREIAGGARQGLRRTVVAQARRSTEGALRAVERLAAERREALELAAAELAAQAPGRGRRQRTDRGCR